MSSGGELQIVTFGLGAEVFAVPVSLVREILDYRETFRLPNGPDYLLGLTDMRGQGVTTVDLRLRLGLPASAPTPSTRILVVDVPIGDRVLMLGLVVDRVLEVCSVATDQLEAAPDIGVHWPSDYIGGVFRRAEGFVVLVEMGRIFSPDEAGVLDRPAAAA
ncbi:chemotaxis protein CheW [Sphingomonas sp. ABOLD]|uniref:Purine-binding chemotaxis protein CheW n=1 Tax=Sphingomonas trueperi TaxID=53317 RepID=A0A7X5Y0S9_9SPHN|nr:MULTISPECIES: chemotaxis protein CheW [Sphingomonas]NJB98515.1 purine-binding chemotaxis protein CheW [Sphingomonas trueperi]RSV36671.1 chemotaxis protein CheW [Sphingomonas sp. ABOLD]RSV40827.1 chemotaxis protein CheW [Sphingomonas sp. ABOLE]